MHLSEITLSDVELQALINLSKGLPPNIDMEEAKTLKELGLVEWLPPHGLVITLEGKQYVSLTLANKANAKKLTMRFWIATVIAILSLVVSALTWLFK